MSQSLLSLANPSVFDIHPYLPAKLTHACQRETRASTVIKLASNENPLGCSPQVQLALQQALDDIASYPDTHGIVLRKALSEKYHLAIDQAIIGNGSEELLGLLLQAFIIPGEEVLLGQFSFMGYDNLVKAARGQVIKVPMPDWTFDLDAILASLSAKTKMIILANPNNPTGTYYSLSEFNHFMQQLPSSVLVVSDEAYFEYINKSDYPQTHLLLEKYPNLIVTRTFSKAYGLAGMRVGYALAHEDIIALINRIRLPFNVNTLAQVAALAALKDQSFLEDCIQANQVHREQLCQGLNKLGIAFIPSETNFVMLNLKVDGMAVTQAMYQRGITIRPLTFYDLKQHVRVTVGLEVENKTFLSELEQILLKEKVA